MASKPRSAYELRKINLKAVLLQWGGPTNLAKQLGHSGPSYLSQLIGEGRPITEKTARRLEKQLELPMGWLDQEHDLKSTAAPLDQTQMIKAVMAVGAALEDEGLQVKPGKFADLVALVYEEAVKKGEVEENFVQRIVRLTK